MYSRNTQTEKYIYVAFVSLILTQLETLPGTIRLTTLTNLQIAPVTTEKEMNTQTCLQVNGTDDQSIEIQSVLPDMTDFKFLGEFNLLIFL